MFGKSPPKEEESPAVRRTATEKAIKVHGPGPFSYGESSYVSINRFLDLLSVNKFCSVGAKRELIFLDRESEPLKDYFYQFLKSINEEKKSNPAEEGTPPTQPIDNLPIDSSTEEKKLLPTKDEDTTPTQPLHNKTTVLRSEEKIVITKQPHELLDALVKFVVKDLKPLRRNEETVIQEIVADFNAQVKDEKEKQKIPLEIFLKKKKGYCRHHTLLAAYLLASLIKWMNEKKISGFNIIDHHIYHFRDDLYEKETKEKTRHAVIVYMTNNHLYLIDCSFKFTLDITNLLINSEIKKTLEEKYEKYKIIEFMTELYNSVIKTEPAKKEGDKKRKRSDDLSANHEDDKIKRASYTRCGVTCVDGVKC